MDINGLLGTRKCSCGKTHSCDIKAVEIGAGAVKSVRELTAPYKNVLLVADKNTYAVCGEAVAGELRGRLKDTLIYDEEGLLIPNETAVEKMSRRVTEDTDLIMGIGSGVIQDLCKYVSHKSRLPYQIVATAPSMDGYASVGAAMIMGNMKVTYSAHVPEAIIGDTDILKDAPMRMIQAGYGDILGKFSCLNDWKLGAVVNDEYFCDEVYDLTYDMLRKTKDLGEKLLKRDADAVCTLMEALVGAGVAMAYVGNSRPASGSEHHLSHFFEVVGILNNEPYFPHGIDVAYSSVCTEMLREKLLKYKTCPTRGTGSYKFDREAWEKDIRAVYTDAADGVIALQDKLGWYETDRLPVYQSRWDKIRDVLSEAPSSEEMLRYIQSAGLDFTEFEKMYGRQKIENALRYGKDLKDRYTVLWMYRDLMS